MTQPTDFQLQCPAPTSRHDRVQMAHGGGGRLMQRLIEEMFLPAFGTSRTDGVQHDSAIVTLGDARLAFTTDTFVVSPLFFPGGDIGKLAVCGTVNDLAMAGAKPVCLSVGIVLEEGLPMETLEKIVASLQRTAEQAGVQIVTGDTKVVDRGKADGVYINTSGIGSLEPGVAIDPSQVQPGDAVLVSGDLGRHGMAVMSVREHLEFGTTLESDCAPLNGLVDRLLEADCPVHCLRDLTRGGLASALNEIATGAGVGIELDESSVPVCQPVGAACELLGLDPLYVANEGRLVAFVPAESATKALVIMQAAPEASDAAIIGRVTSANAGVVQLHGPFGGARILDLLSGEQMPRIC